ncbi:ABC transporter ATP-binding protein [Rudaeicoccus suwonensis]|uniref:ABC-type multidrug transport system fused ATPase/permease subunit n=1 Tax=Rudaeicoccus suwonensis TaxID=657409 RepID=A0A561E8P8_9MICO|nr:ABC transporter ATP-binding protein [Rudaeicoccus suwonensis]TWE11992.1 ABC-type multidrug transport system fused ATPase/permease subunit [Rudaeicoccus suwonensis]
MIADLRYLLSTFTARERRLLGVYAVAQFVVATLDLVSIAAILPLMQIVTGSSLDHGTLGYIHRMLGSQPRDPFVLSLAGLMILAFILKALLASVLMWWSSGFIARLQTRTSRRLLAVYMSEDYLQHRRRNTAELMRTIGSAVQAAHVSVLGGLLTAFSSALSMVLIAVLLLIVAPIPTIVAAAYFGIIVFAIQRLLAGANHRAGEEAQHASWLSSHALIDAMQGYREAVLHDAQDFFVDRFDTGNQLAAQSARRANYFAGLPKYLLELVTMIGLVVLIVAEVLSGDAQSAMPTLSLFVASTVKILPLMVGLTATIGMIRVGRDGLKHTVVALRDTAQARDDAAARTNNAPLAQDAPIQLKDICFRYPDGTRDIVRGVNLTVPPGSSLAVCGPTGSGKTTLIDIILGLIPPTSGTVSYDNVPTNTAGNAWHDIVAYVPQDVYIMDDTLAGNVAFGLPVEDRDQQLILQCLADAQLSDLLSELPDGVETLVGERGSRLSGGQRQRLGIARALYRRPKVLVLDEATSALDNETEYKITQTMRALRGRITTILVAHRLSSVRHVDTLAFLEHGDLQGVGTFDEVVAASPTFARLVELGRLDGPTEHGADRNEAGTHDDVGPEARDDGSDMSTRRLR